MIVFIMNKFPHMFMSRDRRYMLSGLPLSAVTPMGEPHKGARVVGMYNTARG